MTNTTERLFNLLPAIYRVRDAEQSDPLRALLSVVAEQLAAMDENLAQLYDDQFIETCADWVAPYIGDLIGYRALYGVVPRVSSPRAEVANTIAYRRRKGTAAMLEQLARDVTSWDGRVVEFFQQLATTQYMNHIRTQNLAAPDLRQWEPLERIGTPFDTAARTLDVRRIASGRGKHNIPNVGIFLFRLGAHALTQSPAAKLDARRWLFSPLGSNSALFNLPIGEETITHLAEPTNVPMPLSRRVLHKYLPTYYGADQSLAIYVDDSPTPVPLEQIVVCDLSDIAGGDWAHKPAQKIGIDPVLGRIAFAEKNDAPDTVRVTFHYGFSAPMGGGEYERAESFDAELQPVQNVSMPAKLTDALSALGGAGVVEVQDSGRYEETPSISAAANQRLEVRAANERRPAVILSGDLFISGGAQSELTLNGLLIAGGTLRVQGALRRLRLRHCTLVPGLTLKLDGTPVSGATPSLIVEAANVSVEIEQCIVGGLRVAEGAQVLIRNSIVDATAESNIAYAGLDESKAQKGLAPGGALQVVNSTVIGKVHTMLLPLASNSIFLARLAETDDWQNPLRVERRQEGCVRFCYVPPGAQTPRCHQCQPASDDDATRVRPQFNSLRYGDAAYAQLATRCAREIRTGADDEAELGAFHDLYQPQRETNLRVRLDEYLRFGLEAGIFYAT